MINAALLDEGVQDYIEKNINTDISKLILKGSPFRNIDVKELATQIQTRKSAQKKLPTWFQAKGIIFPPKLNLEQASSELTAAYKSKLINGGKLIDLTGGFGVDDYYFAKQADRIVHCEINPQLSEIVKHNANILGVTNIDFFIGDSLDYLNNIKQTDVLFIDPSRRTNSGRVFLLQDCEPNIIQNLDLYFKKAKKIILKAAPMLDIDAAVNVLKCVSQIHIISINNECKELLFVLEHNHKPTEIICSLLNSLNETTYTFIYKEEKAIEVTYSGVKDYIYEPDAAFTKAGLFKTLAKEFNLFKLHQNTHLYTSNTLLENFPGRVMKVNQKIDFKTFTEKNKIKKANIITKNFNLKPEDIKKKLRIADGGDVYLYFTTDKNDNKIVITCERFFFTKKT